MTKRWKCCATANGCEYKETFTAPNVQNAMKQFMEFLGDGAVMMTEITVKLETDR